MAESLSYTLSRGSSIPVKVDINYFAILIHRRDIQRVIKTFRRGMAYEEFCLCSLLLDEVDMQRVIYYVTLHDKKDRDWSSIDKAIKEIYKDDNVRKLVYGEAVIYENNYQRMSEKALDPETMLPGEEGISFPICYSKYLTDIINIDKALASVLYLTLYRTKQEHCPKNYIQELEQTVSDFKDTNLKKYCINILKALEIFSNTSLMCILYLSTIKYLDPLSLIIEYLVSCGNFFALYKLIQLRKEDILPSLYPEDESKEVIRDHFVNACEQQNFVSTVIVYLNQYRVYNFIKVLIDYYGKDVVRKAVDPGFHMHDSELLNKLISYDIFVTEPCFIDSSWFGKISYSRFKKSFQTFIKFYNPRFLIYNLMHSCDSELTVLADYMEWKLDIKVLVTLIEAYITSVGVESSDDILCKFMEKALSDFYKNRTYHELPLIELFTGIEGIYYAKGEIPSKCADFFTYFFRDYNR